MAFITSTLFRNITRRPIFLSSLRRYSDGGGESSTNQGLVLGVYTDPESKDFKMTPATQKYNSETGGRLEDMIKESSPLERGKAHVYENLEGTYRSVAVVGLGAEDTGFNPLENLDECRENVRIAAAVGALRLRDGGMSTIHVESMGNPEAAAEGALLSVWRYQELRAKEDHRLVPVIEFYGDPGEERESFQRGQFKADAQNLARLLSDTPPNLMTPAIFAQKTVDILCPCGLSVEVKDKDWSETKHLSAFLAVAKGSTEPPVFLEINYCGGQMDEKPIVFVGKGITFDAGGLNIKKCPPMEEYRADMSGAAVIVAVMKAIASLTLPMNVSAVIPLCENMPSGMSMKPGDVVISRSGKSIQIDNTDNEGRLLLADGITYAIDIFKPRLLIDVAALSRGMKAALGNASTGVFTNNIDLWNQMSKAGSISGDRVWRFPLWEYFTQKVTNIPSADITNQGWGPGGSPCRAAAFLKEFVSCGDWIHMDIASCGMRADTHEIPYLLPGLMTGRPTRTIIQFLYQLACPSTFSADKPPGGTIGGGSKDDKEGKE